MDTFRNYCEVKCSICGCIPVTINMDYTYDYDGNDRIHEYGHYNCQCGHDESFMTNNPYENESDAYPPDLHNY